ncbi:hypothetical protein H8B15_02150 [Hymenobacter sp. BT507]|uniref:DUF4130 domain-containing protein n=1 Tax=Hymenobacter citatus TaxID=2763506 RepID=A0ABR7MF46_9BACT|nr:hypothetical protein [Hymenobacter citatus]MBC6609706.1 hypothetical protein [Hymenobacter citatus]
MQVYSYWARATLDCADAAGLPYHLTAYAGSDNSEAAAKQAVAQLLHTRHARLLANQALAEYPTGSAPLREELLQRLHNKQGEMIGALTRNHYGSIVLNTLAVMFLDIDAVDLRERIYPTLPPLSVSEFFRRLFSPPPAPVYRDLDESLQLRLTAWLHQHPNWNFRVYRTRLGFRLLVTHQLLTPDTAAAQAVFTAFRTDATYVRLCQKQHCYRARLSPKPWRIGWQRPWLVFPYDTPAEQQEQRAWEQAYADRSAAYSVCAWVGDYGSGHVCPDAAQLIELHDAACLGGRPLA